METLWAELISWIQHHHVITGIRLTLMWLIGFPGLRILSRLVGHFFTRDLNDKNGVLIQTFIFYIGISLLTISTLRELGFQLTTLLGAAGIAGAAIGFASQTSLSNLISGIFLIGEKPFEIGDLIQIDQHRGRVESIDPLSIKLRTLDNLYIRIPNEQLIKAAFTNITRYPVRRMDLEIGVAYKEDIVRVMNILKEIATDNTFVLDEPEPVILFKEFGDSSLNLMFGVWFQKDQFVDTKNAIMCNIKERFDAEGIEIPFPHRVLYTGSETTPFPVNMTSEDALTKQNSNNSP